MRVRIIFNLRNKGAYLPFHHQYLLAQTAKAVLVSGESQEFIDYPYYHFSGLKGQTRISKQGLHYYSSKVTLVLASPSKEYLDHFLESLFAQPEIHIGNLVLLPYEVEREVAPEITDASKFVCISPMVLLTPSLFDASAKRFIEPESDEFSDMLYDSTISRMESYGYTGEQLASFFKFQIVPDLEYLNRIRSGGKKFARIYPLYDQDVKYEVRGYTFPFTLYAAREVQEFVFTCGLGVHTNKGFGMLDIANSNPINRTEKYEVGGLVTDLEAVND
ncbi:MAG: CRISPR-associated endoribonuclease Cas6 [Cyclobacteriaceae bacterium]